MAKYPLAASIFFVLAITGECHLERLMSFDKITYLSAEIPQTPQTLTIDANGQARYESHTNEATPDYPEIGIYETTLPASEVQTLSSLLNNPLFNSLPDHSGRVMSGDRWKRIRVTAGKETSEKLVGTREAVDPGMSKIIDGLDQVVVKLKSHPQQALRIELTQPTINSAWVLTATMSLSSTGVQSINCRNPLALLNATN